MTDVHGYILTRDHFTRRGRHFLRFTGIGSHGPFEVIITRDRPLFFIARHTIIPAHVRFQERKSVNLTAFNRSPVDALYFATQPQLYGARKTLHQQGILTYEADIRPEDRYLMERFIQGGIRIRGHAVQKGGLLRFSDPVLAAADYTPELSVLSLDIETGRRGELYSIACHFESGRRRPGRERPRVAGIVLIIDRNPPKGTGKGPPPMDIGITGATFEPLTDTGWMIRLADEKTLMEHFLSIVAILDPDILIGWHVIGFDLTFLEGKCREHGLDFTLGRDRQVPAFREIRKGAWAVDIRGRIVIDGPPALRGAFYTFDNFRLETVAKTLLGQGKDIGQDQGKVAEIERRFRQDKKGLARYNLLDCTLVLDIFKHTGLIDLTWKRARLSGLPMDQVGRSVAAFDHFMLPRLHRHGFVAPNIRDIRDNGHAPGGWVFTQSPGFYERIAVFDFKSLYPSIIRTFNIDPLSRLSAGDAPLTTPLDIRFSRKTHVLPGFIANLMAQREQAKADGDPHLSQAVKILMNSFYGVMGTLKSRFYNPDLSRSITGTGRWLLKITREYLEAHGYAVLYGDTDSVFVPLKPVAGQDSERAAKNLAGEINRFLTRTIRDRFDLESQLEIEFEKLFTRFFLPALRGGGDGAKKRYAGLVKKGDKEELVFTGLEFVRSDWTRFARQFQYGLFQRVFQDQDAAAWIRRTIEELKAGVHDKDLVYKKRLTKPAKAYVKTVPPHVRAARMLGDSQPISNEISYVYTLGGPVPEALPHKDLDYNHYLEKQLKPIADAVLCFFDLSVAEIMGGKQLKLF